MKNYYYLIIFIVFISISCKSDFDRILENQDEILSLCKDKTIDNVPSRNFYMLETYKQDEGLINRYFFEKIKKKDSFYYALKMDTIQFCPDVVLNMNVDNTDEYEHKICDYYSKASSILNSYNILHISRKLYKNHPTLKCTIFLEGGEIFVYHPDIDESNDFTNYKSIKKGWYLYDPN